MDHLQDLTRDDYEILASRMPARALCAYFAADERDSAIMKANAQSTQTPPLREAVRQFYAAQADAETGLMRIPLAIVEPVGRFAEFGLPSSAVCRFCGTPPREDGRACCSLADGECSACGQPEDRAHMADCPHGGVPPVIDATFAAAFVANARRAALASLAQQFGAYVPPAAEAHDCRANVVSDAGGVRCLQCGDDVPLCVQMGHHVRAPLDPFCIHCGERLEVEPK